MNLKQLETFLWVAALKSFRKAAKRLNTTQPAISSRIAGLENDLGLRLFERAAGAVELTSKGQELLPYAEKVLRSVEHLRGQAGETAKLSGLLRLGVSETVVHTWLPEFLNRLHSIYPAVDVDLTVDVTANLRHEIVSHTLDLAFLMGPISDYNVVNLELGHFPMIWAARPRLVPVKRRLLSEEDIATFPILTYARNTRPYAEIQTHFRETVSVPVRIFASSSLAACLRMAYDGIGVATLPWVIAKSDIARGKLVPVKCRWTPSDLGFTASYTNEPRNPLAEQAANLAHQIAAGWVRANKM